jgi:hypothetical protein
MTKLPDSLTDLLENPLQDIPEDEPSLFQKLREAIDALFPERLSKDGFKASACGCCGDNPCMFQITVMDAYGRTEIRCGALHYPNPEERRT